MNSETMRRYHNHRPLEICVLPRIFEDQVSLKHGLTFNGIDPSSEALAYTSLYVKSFHVDATLERLHLSSIHVTAFAVFTM